MRKIMTKEKIALLLSAVVFMMPWILVCVRWMLPIGLFGLILLVLLLRNTDYGVEQLRGSFRVPYVVLGLLVNGWIARDFFDAFVSAFLTSHLLNRIFALIPFLHISPKIASAALCVVFALLSLPFTCNLIRLFFADLTPTFSRAIKQFFSSQGMRRFWKSAAKSACILLIGITLGLGLLTAVFQIPTERIDRNVRSSAAVLAREDVYPTVSSNRKLDNFTDSVMLLNAADDTEASALKKAVMVYRGTTTAQNGQSSYDSLVDHYIGGEAFAEKKTYARYWHGYLVFLKPLLLVMDYSAIRILNGAVQGLLTLIVIVSLLRKRLYCPAVSFLLMYAAISPILLLKSLQFSSCYYLLMLGCLVILWLPERSENDKKYLYAFLCIGIATAYFDFLTYPVATFGIPAAVYICLKRASGEKHKLWELCHTFAFWGVGYAGMWGSKWLLGTMLYGKEIMSDALQTISFRTSNFNEGEVLYWNNCVIQTFKKFFSTPMSLILFVVLVLWIVRYVMKCRRDPRLLKRDIRLVPEYLFIALLPFAWFAVMLNHSTVHLQLSSKEYITSVFAVLCMFGELQKRQNAKSPKEKNDTGPQSM
ncbi:MAG: hypothetical protein K6F09_02325 [Clostridiales bacterium]|nr:hypothetical protein [Clostridiales bacterium]